jgi:hypothetical protein
MQQAVTVFTDDLDPGSSRTGTGARSTIKTGRPVPDSGRAHDVSALTAGELERARIAGSR